MEILKHIPYPSEKDLADDKEYFLKKFGWTSDQLTEYLSRPEIPHEFYGSENWLWDGFENIKSKFKKLIKYNGGV